MYCLSEQQTTPPSSSKHVYFQVVGPNVSPSATVSGIEAPCVSRLLKALVIFGFPSAGGFMNHCGGLTFWGRISAKKMSNVQMYKPVSRPADVM